MVYWEFVETFDFWLCFADQPQVGRLTMHPPKLGVSIAQANLECAHPNASGA
jgi:hypothetical protein